MDPVVDAVVIKRYVGRECPNCGGPIVSIADDVELGTVWRIKLASRATVPVTSHGNTFRVDCVRREGDGWVPVELLNWPGK